MKPLGPGDLQEIDRYKLLFLLGQGGMGRVYLGRSPAGTLVAVKIILPEYANENDFRARFRREVEAAKRVSGVFTASVHGAGPNDSPPWLATEYVAGPSLAEAVAASRRLPVNAVWRLTAGLVEALKAVHDCGLVHRDLKPANVLLTANGPKVIDFGISRSTAGTGTSQSWATLPAVTSTGGWIGTPGFMAPEQQFGDKVGPATDVYALGKVIAYAATGSAEVVDGIGPNLGSGSGQRGLAAIPAELRDLVASCLRLRPEDRPSLSRLLETVVAASPYPQTSRLDFWPEPLASLVRQKEDQLRRQLDISHHGPRPTATATKRAVPEPDARQPVTRPPGDDPFHYRGTETARPAGGRGAYRVPPPPGPSAPRLAASRGLSGALFAAYRPNGRRDSAASRRSGAQRGAEGHAFDGELLYDERRFAEAAQSYRESIRLDPKNPVAHVDLGRVLYALQRGMDAESSFERAVELDPLLIAAHRNRYLTIDMMTGRTPELRAVREEAEAACEDVIGLDAEDTAALANLGDAYFCLSRTREAADAYQRALAIDEGNRRLLAKLDYAWKQHR
jgi:serine/threonine protein kinase